MQYTYMHSRTKWLFKKIGIALQDFQLKGTFIDLGP